MKRALFVGSLTDIFAGQLSLELMKRDWEVDAFVGHRNASIYPRLRECFTRVFNPFFICSGVAILNPFALLQFLFSRIYFSSQKYEIVHFHYAANPIGLLLTFLIPNSFRKVLTVYGSDFYRSGPVARFFIRQATRRYDVITFANQKTADDFRNELKLEGLFRGRIEICHFGLRVLDVLRDRTTHQPTRAAHPPYVVAIGYNGDPGQRHIEIVRELAKLPQETKAKIEALLQFTYGLPSSTYAQKVCEALEEAGIQYEVVEGFQTLERVADLRLKTDILIQLQTTDQLSGSMQESLFLGSVVMTGSWLPYGVFKNMNVKFFEVAEMSEVSASLQKIVEEFPAMRDQVKDNRQAIYQLSSWEFCAPEWTEAYGR